MVYITGDTHGDAARFQSKAFRVLGKGDVLIVCGDFGFLWDNSRQEQRMLRKLAAKKYTICFVDGTHENFDLLNAYDVTCWNGGKVHQIAPNIYHLMRGQIFTIDGLKIFTFGGGESFDRPARKEHETWWMEEMPSPEQLYEGAKNIDRAGCQVDIIITHEPTARVKGMLRLEVTDTVKICGLNRYFEELAQICKFRHWYFGAMHCDHCIPPNQTAVFKALIRLDETELAPPKAVERPLKRPVYAGASQVFHQHQPESRQNTPGNHPRYSPPEKEKQRKAAYVKNVPEAANVTPQYRPARVSHTQGNGPSLPSALPEQPLPSQPAGENYTAAYRDITKLIDSILADDRGKD